jgi:TonB family protein
VSSTAQAQGHDPNGFVEQRIYLRKKVARPLPIELLPGKGVWLHDLGEGGLSVSGSSPLQLGTNTYLSFQLPETNTMIEAAGVVAWSDISGRVGVRFTRVKPDSTAALKRWLKVENAMNDAHAAISGEAAMDEPLAARIHSLDLVSELQSQLAGVEDRDVALDLVAQRMLALTRASGAAIALREGPDVICRASAGNAPPVGMKLTLDSSLSGECFRTGNLVLLGDSDNDPRVDPEVCRDLNFRSLLIHPVMSEDQVTGILEVLSPLPGNFEGGDVLVLGFVAEMVASLDPNAVSPSSPVALAELSQFSAPIAEQTDEPYFASAMADPAEEVVAKDALDEPFFALKSEQFSDVAPVDIEFEPLPSWVHEPLKPGIADVEPYMEPVAEQYEVDLAHLPAAAVAPARIRETPATVVPISPLPVADRDVARPAFKAHEATARTRFRAHEADVQARNRVPVLVAAGAAVALLIAGGSYFGLRSNGARSTTANTAPISTPAVTAPAAASDTSTVAASAPKSTPTADHKNVKSAKPAGAATTKQQEAPEDEVAVTLSRDLASSSIKTRENTEAPAAPSLTGIGSGGGAIDSVTALAGAPTTRVDTEARATASPSSTFAGVTGGQLLRRVPPIYPDFARRSGITGSVVLTGIVTKDGTVKHIKVVSGNSMLADAAVRAVSAWRYSPFMLNGKPVETETRIVLNFNH